jgi:AcrR family transcriptional regulator
LIIEAAAQLLAESPHGDISTRAVSEAAGIQQSVIYRHFGDKDVLLAAAVDFGFEKYLASKRDAIKAVDPVDDLISGWDSHTAFALANPNFYRLIFTPGLSVAPSSAPEALALLVEVLERVADEGRLRFPTALAARMIMAANTGVALALIGQDVTERDPQLSPLVRDAIHRSVLTDSPERDATTDARAVAAATLLGGIEDFRKSTLTDGEAGLLSELLVRIAKGQTH